MGYRDDPKSLRRQVEDLLVKSSPVDIQRPTGPEIADLLEPPEALPDPTTAGLLRRYLLGDVPEDERLQIEELYFNDDSVFTLISVVEDELVDDYVGGVLNDADRERFELNYLNSEERRQRVQFACALDSAGLEAVLVDRQRVQFMPPLGLEAIPDLSRLLDALLARMSTYLPNLEVMLLELQDPPYLHAGRLKRALQPRAESAKDLFTREAHAAPDGSWSFVRSEIDDARNALGNLLHFLLDLPQKKDISKTERDIYLRGMWLSIRPMAGTDEAATKLLDSLLGRLLKDEAQSERASDRIRKLVAFLIAAKRTSRRKPRFPLQEDEAAHL